MKIKTLNGDLEEVDETFTYCTWVKWTDIKPILEEYQAAIENTQKGISDYSLLGEERLEDLD